MDNDILTINESDLAFAQNLCSLISDVSKRNRAVANVLAAKIAAKYFKRDDFNVDIETSLHNVTRVMEDIDISDIYVNGNYVDVRVYFSDDEICVPKSHFDINLQPAVYMFIKLRSDLSDGTVTGFITPGSIDKNSQDNDYFYINKSSLNSYYDIEQRLSTKALDLQEFSKEDIYDYVDNTLTEDKRNVLFGSLVKSITARTLLIKAVKAASIYNFVSTPEVQIAEHTVQEPPMETQVNLTEEDLDDFFLDDGEASSLEEQKQTSAPESSDFATNITPSSADIIADVDNENIQENGENSEQIENLFTGEQEGVPLPKKKKSNGFVTFMVLVALISAAGYWYYSNYVNKSINELPDNSVNVISEESGTDSNTADIETQKSDAMPNETVESNNTVSTKEEGNSIAIPAIEKNLDASVLVSNLKVYMEVPAGYASNVSAKRYLQTLGKRIQLSLKMELLLLTKPPISDKIAIEITYNNNAGQFEFVGIKESSGEKTVDDVIVNTVKNALSTNASINKESFAKLQGNPIVIIHL